MRRSRRSAAGLAHVLADRLRIYRRDAKRRIEEAVELARAAGVDRRTAAPQARVHGGRAARRAHRRRARARSSASSSPSCPAGSTRRPGCEAEHKLAEVAAAYRPDELKRFADWYTTVLNPDGDFSDEHRARKRAISIGRQHKDGMSTINGWLDPELRAGLDAVLSKWAAPGRCNPGDEKPTVDGEPSPDALDADERSAAQRNHDALNMMVRNTLMSGELGSHQGLPVTIIATVALTDLQAKAGVARTGGGTLLPVTTLIRMAAHADNYLLVFDDAKPLQLYKGRSTRLATPAQRLVLYAAERGCTPPRLRRAGLLVPGAPRQQRLGQRRTHQHRRPHLVLRTAQPRRQRRRLDNPKTPRRHHRMDPTTTPGSRPTAAPTPTTTPKKCCPTTKTKGTTPSPSTSRDGDFGLGSRNGYRGATVRHPRRLLRALEYLLFSPRFAVGVQAAPNRSKESRRIWQRKTAP